MSNKKNSNSQTVKVMERLRKDPKYKEIEKKACRDPDNVNVYANEVIKEFKLGAGWKQKLKHYLLHPNLQVTFTGASIQPYKDPVTGETRYMIPVDPDTTQENVKSAHSLIIDRYKEAGLKTNLRDDNPEATEKQLLAYRLKESGKSIDEILKTMDEKYPEDNLVKNDIHLLIEEGKNKKLG